MSLDLADTARLDARPGPRRRAARPVPEIAEAIEAEQGSTLGGLMAVAPLGADPGAAFAPLRRLSAGGPGGQPGGDDHLGGHERRPGGRHRGTARHT